MDDVGRSKEHPSQRENLLTLVESRSVVPALAPLDPFEPSVAVGGHSERVLDRGHVESSAVDGETSPVSNCLLVPTPEVGLALEQRQDLLTELVEQLRSPVNMRFTEQIINERCMVEPPAEPTSIVLAPSPQARRHPALGEALRRPSPQGCIALDRVRCTDHGGSCPIAAGGEPRPCPLTKLDLGTVRDCDDCA